MLSLWSLFCTERKKSCPYKQLFSCNAHTFTATVASPQQFSCQCAPSLTFKKPFCFLQIHLKITLPFISRISKRSLPFKLSRLNPCKHLFSHTRSTCPAHSIFLNSITITILDEELSITQFSAVSSSHLLPLRSKYFPQNSVPEHPLSVVFP